MPRTAMVTRTFQTTTATILCLDINDAEPFNKEITLPRLYKDNKVILKKAQQIIDDENVKAVAVTKVETNEILYGMKEEDFIANAEVLPARKEYKKD